MCRKVTADRQAAFEPATSDISFRSVEENEFKTKVKTISSWQGHANIEMTFTNTGNKTIHDWYFTFDYPYAIENPYNCKVLEHTEDLYTIGNKDWNQDILPKKSVTIGFTASSADGQDISDVPSFYLLNTKTISLTGTDLSYRYEEYSDWTSGFTGALILKNNTAYAIRDWTITFNSNRQLIQADSSVFSANADGSYTITNDGNNQNISKGQEYRIGIQGGQHDPSFPFEISDYSVSAKTLALALDEDNDGNGIWEVREIDYKGNVTVVTPTITPAISATPTVTTIPTITSMPDPTATEAPSPTDTPVPTTSIPTATESPTVTPVITATITPTPTEEPNVTPTVTVIPTTTVNPEEVDYDKDTDGDYIPDDLEPQYGTDKDDPDTDKDGLKDGYELFLGLDPLKKDSDNNGKTDDREDYDKDGLTNKEEQTLGTNPMSEDTDYDKLKDAEEVKLYGTDPLKYDTDDDTISDYNEIRMGTNPKVKDSDTLRYQTLTYQVPQDSELKGVTSVTVKGSISGCIDENTKIKNVYGIDTLSSKIKALVGVPVDIESTGNFGTMTIIFKYGDEVNEEDLKILWYDEENNQYKVLDDSVVDTEANTVSVTTTHFSKYMLIDEGEWVRTWGRSCNRTDNYYNLFEWRYDMAPYLDWLDKQKDSDGDGLPEIIETNGMINNIGEVVKTNPYKLDTDEDGLGDGIEMGLQPCFVKQAVPNIMSSRYNVFVPVSYDIRWDGYVYYKQISDPTNPDTDGDDANDKEDATPNEKNGPINYILYYDDPAITGEKGNYEEYCQWFSSHYMDYESFEINSYDEFECFWRNMCHECNNHSNVKDDSFSRKIKYGRIRNLIVILHGYSNLDGWGFGENPSVQGENAVHLLDVEFIVNNHTKYPIDYVDVQSCYAARDVDGDNKTIASVLVRCDKIDTVFATPGEYRYNYHSNLNFVLFDCIYCFMKDGEGGYISIPLGNSKPLMFWGG